MSSILQEYGFRVMNGKCQVIHKRTGCTTPYNHGKTYNTEPSHYKEEMFKVWFSLSRKMRKSYYMAALNNDLVEGLNMKPSEAIEFLSLAHCKAEPTLNFSKMATIMYDTECCNKEGTNPMYNKIEKTDAADYSRTYLLGRLNEATYVKRDQLRKLFNLDAVAMPKTYKDLIDAIKNDKYTLDTKMTAKIDIFVEDESHYYGSPFEGIIFTDFPKPDYDGHSTAVVAQSKESTKVKDAIYGPSYEVAQKALNDFEAWVPEGKASV